MRWLLWCFCLLAESYETINHWLLTFDRSVFSISLFAGFKALAIHHLKHWLSVFFISMIAFLLARNFGSGTQELPFNGSYPTVWILSATIKWNVHPLPFIWNFARSSRTCSVKRLHNSFFFVVSRTISFLIWIDVLPQGFGQSWDLSFPSLPSRWFSIWFEFGFLRVPFVSQQSYDSGSYVVSPLGSSVNWFVKPLKEDCFSSANFNALSSISLMSYVFWALWHFLFQVSLLPPIDFVFSIDPSLVALKANF